MALPPARVRAPRGLEAPSLAAEDLLAQLPQSMTDMGLAGEDAAAFQELRLFLMREFEITSALTTMLVHNLANVMWQMAALEKTRGSIVRAGMVEVLTKMGMFKVEIDPDRPERFRAGDPSAVASVKEDARIRNIRLSDAQLQALVECAPKLSSLEYLLAMLERRKLKLIREIDYRGALSLSIRLRRLDVALKERTLAALDDATT